MMKKSAIKKRQIRTAFQPSPAKRHAFTAIAWLTPLLLLLLMEALLRLGGYAGRPPLFVSAPPPFSHLMTINPQIAQRYFHRDRFFPTPALDPFIKEKAPNGLRIFVLGGSTAAGFPYERNLRFSRILESALQQKYSERTVEVVNLAMSAINSYALLDFMDELLLQKPDAILIYAGHNEYYGALGVASRESLGRRRGWVLTALKLQQLRLFNLMRNAASKLRAGNRAAPTATLMERVVADQQIPFDGPLYHAGVEQFEKNMRAIVEKAGRQGVPVVLGELVCNLKNPPFISLPEGSADAVFQQAVLAEMSGDYAAAKSLYLSAKELDALRFRAPEAINDVIRKLASEFRQPLVPVADRFQAASPNGIIGDELMIDHLHPNIDGYFLVAQAFAEQLAQAQLLPNDGAAAPAIDKRMGGYTAVDSLYGALGIRVLKASWPFTDTTFTGHALDSFVPQSLAEELALKAVKYDNFSLRTAHETMAAHYEQNGEMDAALQEYRALSAFGLLSPTPQLKFAELLNRKQAFEDAVAVLLPALHLDDAGHAHILLGQAFLGLRRYDQAIAHFEQAQKKLGADAIITQGLALARRQKESEAGSASALVSGVVPVSPEAAGLMQRAQQYMREKSYDQALDVLQQVIAGQDIPLAHLWLGQIFIDRGNLKAAIGHLQKAHTGLPNHPYLLYNLTAAYVETGAYREAQEALATLERIQPDFGDPYGLKEKITAAHQKK